MIAKKLIAVCTAVCAFAAALSLSACGHEHTLVKREAVVATCTEDGHVAYYECSDCGALFADEAATTAMTKEEASVKAVGHTLVKREAVVATCTEDGEIAHYECTVCGGLFSDDAATAAISREEAVLPASGHTYTTDLLPDGDKHAHLATCGHETRKEVKNHTFVDGVCSACGALQTGLTFRPDGDGLALAWIGEGYSQTQLIVPSVRDGKSVTAIAGAVAKGNETTLESAVIPVGVRKIGTSAFADCNNNRFEIFYEGSAEEWEEVQTAFPDNRVWIYSADAPVADTPLYAGYWRYEGDSVKKYSFDGTSREGAIELALAMDSEYRYTIPTTGLWFKLSPKAGTTFLIASETQNTGIQIYAAESTVEQTYGGENGFDFSLTIEERETKYLLIRPSEEREVVFTVRISTTVGTEIGAGDTEYTLTSADVEKGRLNFYCPVEAGEYAVTVERYIAGTGRAQAIVFTVQRQNVFDISVSGEEWSGTVAEAMNLGVEISLTGSDAGENPCKEGDVIVVTITKTA
ncbi:MAG: hypothetical protein ACI4NG_01355 [Candidatus Gallimonas sp.]